MIKHPLRHALSVFAVRPAQQHLLNQIYCIYEKIKKAQILILETKIITNLINNEFSYWN